MKIIKRIISALLLVVFCLQGVSVFAEGDPNIDTAAEIFRTAVRTTSGIPAMTVFA